MKKKDHVDHILDQWKKVKPDLDSSPVAVIGRLSRVAKIMTPQIQAGMTPFGLTAIEFDILATLRRNDIPLTPTQLYQSTMLSSGAMTANLDKLENRGLLQRQHNDKDRRSCTVSLTLTGINLIDEAYVAHLSNENKMLEPLEASERTQLANLLQRWLAENE